MIIATRTLMLRRPDGDTEIPIRIFAPEKQTVDWKCRFEIDWPEGRLERYAVGIDTIQAIHLTLQMIGICTRVVITGPEACFGTSLAADMAFR